MKLKQAKKHFYTTTWMPNNLSSFLVNMDKYNKKKSQISKRYNINIETLNYIVEDLNIFDKTQLFEMIEFGGTKEYKEAVLTILENNVFEQFCDKVNVTLDSENIYINEINLHLQSLNEKQLKDFNTIWSTNDCNVDMDDMKTSNYNQLFEITQDKNTTLFLLMMDAYIQDEKIMIGSHIVSERPGVKKSKIFNLYFDYNFSLQNVLLPNGKQFTIEEWELLKRKEDNGSL